MPSPIDHQTKRLSVMQCIAQLFIGTKHIGMFVVCVAMLSVLSTTTASMAVAQDRLSVEVEDGEQNIEIDANRNATATRRTGKERIEAKVERMHHEDSGSRIEEVRIEGQSKSVKVQPKTIKIKPYQVDTQPENGSLINQGSNRTGKTNRSWSVFKF